MTDRPARDLKLSPEQLLDDLAQRDEAEATGAPQTNADADSTFKVLKAELDTLASQLREPAPVVPFEDESNCRRVTELVEALGIDPSQAGRKQPAAEPAEAEPLGDLGQYRLLAKLGEGGMGTVYKALHTRLDKIVAVKVLPREKMGDLQAVARFEREMRAVGKLEHPNIVRAMDANQHDKTHYLVMEYVDGVDLSELVHRIGPLSVADACELVRQAAIGLQHAHEHDLVHRDIKPSNLMLTKQGQVKILDLGLARLHTENIGELTSAGQLMGTIDYMAPEQTGDSHDVDIRADIYGLGATLFKLLCDRAPYAEKRFDTAIKRLKALATQPVPSIQELRAEIPADLDTVVKKMLAKEAADRYATPQQLVDALQPFAGQCDLRILVAGYEQQCIADEESSKAALSSTKQYITDAMTETKSTKVAEQESDRFAATIDSQVTANQPEAVAELPTVTPTPTPDRGKLAIDTRPRPGASRPARGGRSRNDGRHRILAAAFGGILLLGAITLFFQSKNGTIVVQIDDPEGLIEVSVVGENLVINDKQKAGEPITLGAGDHKLRVTRGELEFESDNFTLKRGDRIVLNVKLAEGQVQVVRDQTIIGKRDMPAASRLGRDPAYRTADPDRRAAEWVLGIGGTIGVSINGEPREYKWVTELPQRFQIERVVLQHNAKLTDEGLKNLNGLMGLRELHLGYTEVTDAGLEHLKELTSLGVLTLPDLKITDSGLEHLRGLKNLTQLYLDQTRISDAGIQRLHAFPLLSSLSLNATAVSNQGLEHIGLIAGLGQLRLGNTKVSDTGLEHLKGLTKLHALDIAETQVTDRGLEHIKGMTIESDLVNGNVL